LESKIQALESNHDNLIPEHELADVARIKEQRDAALSEFENPIYAAFKLSKTLKFLSRKMDSSGLLRFIVDVEEM
jgi:hypothetical protein